MPLLRGWAGWARQTARQKRLLLHLFTRKLAQSACNAYYTWLHACTELRKQRVLLGRCMERMLRGTPPLDFSGHLHSRSRMPLCLSFSLCLTNWSIPDKLYRARLAAERLAGMV